MRTEPARGWRRTGAIIGVAAAAACVAEPGVLEPAGPAAAATARLSWLLFGVGAVVFVAFAAALLAAILRSRGPADGRPIRVDGAAERRTVRNVVVAGAIAPAAVLLALYVATLLALRANARPPVEPRVIIELHGRLWWWEVRYPGGAGAPDAVTANELHIPAGEPVEVRLHSNNVIHSFWVPALAGKLDLIPGKTNVTWIQADTAGVYRGQCAEYCGLQHARMGLLVIAESRPAFVAWLARQREPATVTADATLAAGLGPFLTHCGSCHTVRGTAADGTEGPDLTHFGSRRTLAAGTAPNTIEHLGGWIARAQAIKPGSKMPNIGMTAAEHAAILDLLRRLQ